MAYRNDPEVSRHENWIPMRDADAVHLVREQSQIQPGESGQWFRFAIEWKETHALVGDCGLKCGQFDPRQAEIAFVISRPFQGMGIATEAVAVVVDYAFTNFGLHRIFALTNTANSPACSLLDRLWMRREGHLKQSSWCHGHWVDQYVYAILREEWLAQSHAD